MSHQIYKIPITTSIELISLVNKLTSWQTGNASLKQIHDKVVFIKLLIKNGNNNIYIMEIIKKLIMTEKCFYNNKNNFL